jgi:hypothetical protein
MNNSKFENYFDYEEQTEEEKTPFEHELDAIGVIVKPLLKIADGNRIDIQVITRNTIVVRYRKQNVEKMFHYQTNGVDLLVDLVKE